MRQLVTSVVAVPLLLGACTAAWPPPGGGGFAEVRAANEDPELLVAENASFSDALRRIDQLRGQGAERRLPGRMAMIDRQVARVQRALAAGLVDDAAIDLYALQAELDVVTELLRQPVSMAARP